MKAFGPRRSADPGHVAPERRELRLRLHARGPGALQLRGQRRAAEAELREAREVREARGQRRQAGVA